MVFPLASCHWIELSISGRKILVSSTLLGHFSSYTLLLAGRITNQPGLAVATVNLHVVVTMLM